MGYRAEAGKGRVWSRGHVAQCLCRLCRPIKSPFSPRASRNVRVCASLCADLLPGTDTAQDGPHAHAWQGNERLRSPLHPLCSQRACCVAVFLDSCLIIGFPRAQWLKNNFSAEEVIDLIVKSAKKGLTPSKIGEC